MTSGTVIRWELRVECADETSQHKLDLVHSALDANILRRVQKLQIAGEKQEIVQFAGRTKGNVQELFELAAASSTASFRDVRRNRVSGTPHLACKAISLAVRKVTGDAANGQRQDMPFPPNVKFAKVLHNFLGPRSCGQSYTYHLELITYSYRRSGDKQGEAACEVGHV